MTTLKLNGNMKEINIEKKGTPMTRQIANKFYKIARWIDPYGLCDLDKPYYIDSLMNYTLEENIEDLKAYICEGYEAMDLLDDKELLRQYLNIMKEVK